MTRYTVGSDSKGNEITVSMKMILIGVATIILIGLAFGGFYTVDSRERAIVTRYGKIISTPTAGLGFKIPVIDDIHKISIQDYSEIYPNLEAYSKDQQSAKLVVSVTYRLDQSHTEEIFLTYSTRQGVLDRLVTRKLTEVVKTVFGQFSAISSIQERGRLNSSIAEAVQAAVDGPVIILGVQVEDVSFSPTYEKSIEDRMLAEVAVQKEIQNGLREVELKKIKITQNEAIAQATILNAEADADAIRLRGNAEADAILARAKALSSNQMLVDLVKAERWNGVLPISVLPNSTLPFIEASGTSRK